MTTYREYYRRHLPHWQPLGATFFVTFRLKFSLPEAIVASLREAQESKAFEQEQPGSDEGRSFVRYDGFLDKAAFGPQWLSRPDVAASVKAALIYRDGREYDLQAFCIMPNHVHAVFQPLNKGGESNPQLSKIMQLLKRHTAHQANNILSRQGAFRQDESYDRVVRNSDEFLRIVEYVLNNPVKAGLVTKWEDWPWTYCKEGKL